MTKYIVVAGGVMSGVGKGVTTASRESQYLNLSKTISLTRGVYFG